MRMMVRGGVLAAVISVVAAGAVWADTVTIETATGPVAVPENPTPLAVFDLAAIDTLQALGIPMEGTPRPLYLDSLSDVAKQTKPIGTLFEPDFEALATLQPGLIVVGGRSSAQGQALAAIAPVVDMSIWGSDMVGQAKARIAAYGTLFDRRDVADDLTARLDNALTRARAATQSKGTALIVLTNGGKISAFGADSRFGWLHGALNLPEAAAGLESSSHGHPVSFEFLLETDPDWLLVIDRGAAIGAAGQGAKATLDNPIVARMKAAQSGQIVYLDAAPLYLAGGGFSAMMHTLDEIIAAFGGSNG